MARHRPLQRWTRRRRIYAPQFSVGTTVRRFFMEIEEARAAVRLQPTEFQRVLQRAVELDWIRIFSGSINSSASIILEATGIHIAKMLLCLPR